MSPHRAAAKRSGVLGVLGGGYALIGALNVYTPPSDALDAAFAWLPPEMDANDLGWLWVLAGIVLVVISVRARHRPRSRCESAGFVIATVVPILWAFIFVASTFFGNPYGPRGAASYVLLAAIAIYAASWPDPVTLHQREAA